MTGKFQLHSNDESHQGATGKLDRASCGALDLFIRATLALAIGGFLVAFFTNEHFFRWAFERHHNTLSWAIRPLFALPYLYFSWIRSVNGILASILALLTSMFWFPAPEVADEQVARFLAFEQDRLQAGFDVPNVLGLLAVLTYGYLLAMACWRRSIWLGGCVAVGGAVLKVVWSVVQGTEHAGSSIIPFAAGGVFVTVGALLIVVKLQKALLLRKPLDKAT